jgi:DNA polymerase-3 subunit alpha
MSGFVSGQKVQAEGVSHTILMILSVGTILVLICGFLVSLRFKLNLQTHSTLREETAKMRETGRATPESATPEARATVEMLAKTGPLVKKAAALGMPALAITDFTNLCGLVKFYGAAHGAGMKPIIGADFHVQSELLADEMTQISVLAMNNTGYQNLTLLISRAYQRGYGALGPWIDRDWLAELNEGLLLVSGGRMGDVGKSLLRGNSALVEQCVDFYREHFPDRFYLELIRTGRADEENYLHAAVALAEERGLPVVATNDVRFINAEDFDAHEIRVAIHDGFTLDDPKRPRNYSSQQYMRSEEVYAAVLSDKPIIAAGMGSSSMPN